MAKDNKRRRYLLWIAQKGRCTACGRKIRLDLGRFSRFCATIDHVIPRSLGGPDSWENIVLNHRACNEEKADRLPTKGEMHKAQQVQARLAAINVTQGFQF